MLTRTMNHPSIITYESERPYSLRSYILGSLESAHADAACECAMLHGLNGYCLDALDEIPAGSMVPIFERPAQAYAVRGMTHAELMEREALAEQLIAEILAEES